MMRGVDARAKLDGADFSAADLTGAKLHGVNVQGAKLSTAIAEWLDLSADGDGKAKIEDADVARFLAGRLDGRPEPGVRYFGEGDVLRDASLEFGEGSRIHIDSRFEKCTIALADDADLVIGEAGVLKQCHIRGGGNVTIHGKFFERESPGITGARSLLVSSQGALVGTVEQAPDSTRFGFEPGCKLRLRIVRSRSATERSGY
jgi:hypothetical protein